MRRGFFTVVLVALAVAPARASAEQVIEAPVVWHFDALSYTIDQGEPVVFKNTDSVSPGPHDVTANDDGADGKPLFVSATIPSGQQAPVVGATQLKAGSYGFICSVHPFMTATLEVTASGAPAAPDTTAPKLQVTLGRASLDAKAFKATVASDEQADLSARLTAKVSGRTFTVGTATVPRTTSANLRIKASKAASKKLHKARSAKLTLAVEARDAAGNVGTAVASRKVKR